MDCVPKPLSVKSIWQAPSGTGRFTRRRKRNEWWSLGIAMVLLTAALAVFMLEDRASIVTQERSRLQTQARVIEENLVRQLQAVASVLSGLRDEVSASERLGLPARSGITPSGLHLKILNDALPGVRAIYAVDRNGIVLTAEQQTYVGRGAGERPYFTVPRDRHDDAMMFVSPPYLSVLNNYAINLSKSFSDAQGRFAGIVTATLDQSYFEILARSVIYAPDMTVNISHADGEVFLIAPSYARAVGMNQNAAGSPFVRHMQSGAAASLFEETAAENPQPRILALRSVSPSSLHLDKPFVITVSRPLSAVYGRWTEQALVYAGIWALLMMAAGLALFFSQSRRSAVLAAHLAVEAAQRETAQRFELGLKGADLGLWEWHLADDRLTLNDREWRMLGYEPGELDLGHRSWQQLLHPEDWAALETAFTVHVKERTPAYKLEHRLRHKNGDWVWVLDHAMVVERDLRGRALRVLGTHLDITARKRAEQVQEDTAQRLELAMQSGNIGLLDWHLATGEVVLNGLGLAMLGRAGSETGSHGKTGQHGEHDEHDQLFRVAHADTGKLTAAEWVALRHPDDQALVAEAQGALLRSAVRTADLEYRMRHAAGHYIYVHMRAEIVERDAMDRPVRLVGIFRDVSERKHTEAALADAMALQRRTGELARVGGWALDLPDGQPVWTDEVYRIYDLATGQPLGLPRALAGQAPEDRARFDAALLAATTTGTPWDMELQVGTALGRQIWVRSHCEVVLEDGRPKRLVGTVQDTTERMQVQLELQRANGQLAEMSMTDGLTGVANRRHFDQAIAGEWPRSIRQKLPVALLMIDIDYFKAYNDALGHQGGDACLREVAHILARCAWRPGELLARYGGEEFCILLPGSTLDDAKVVAQRCLDRLAQAGIPHPATPPSPWLSISVGVASQVPAVGSLPDALIEQADTALYRAKRGGRARFECAVTDPAARGDAEETPLAWEAASQLSVDRTPAE
ncbi:MAG: hypothetical protein JWQ88_3557 [Rhodoferax sp.]|nr:hypothetical protein [Rhodoferax sp.]